MGDPAGVGPELCLRLLGDSSVLETCQPLVFGDAAVLGRVAESAGLPWRDEWVVSEIGSVPAGRAAVWDLPNIDADGVKAGVFTAATGAAGFHYIERAIEAALGGAVEGVTTGPINKEALHAAGIRFPGHTEIFAERTGAKRWCMMQYSAEVTCTFVTVHVGYAEVPALVTPSRVIEVIELTVDVMHRLVGREPRIVVCGLNPHAGEHGLFGNREEERAIVPAIEAARARGFNVEGPLPPDTAFVPARRRTTDAFVCMYHDQGHIPLKALAFDSAVNTTLGLPVIRTSVDHGTAGDIAWKGLANPGSLFAAVKLAARLARNGKSEIRNPKSETNSNKP
jgi:4-hydroxythreonine-4-phosphate dehydrogenase